MKTLTPDVQYVAPLDWVIPGPHCDIDTAESYHAIADNALDHEADQYFITLQKLATYQFSPTNPDWMTLELTLELKRLASPAKPRIEDWVSENLSGWHITDWCMAEPDDEFEPIRSGAIAQASGHHVAIALWGALTNESNPVFLPMVFCLPLMAPHPSL